MKDLWRLNRPFVSREDTAFERAFHRYGWARAWVADRLGLPRDATVLELGYGQGLFTAELASRLPEGRVVGIDTLSGSVTSGATRSLARRARLLERVALVQSDAFRLPFRDGAFDSVASFLALGDIAMSSGPHRFPTLALELARLVGPGGTVGLADECFPESRPEGAQGRLFDAMRRYWRNRLPSAPRLASALEAAGFRGIEVAGFEPGESLSSADAERELRLGAKWAGPQGVRVNFSRFWREAGDIVRREGRVYPKVIVITARRGARRRAPYATAATSSARRVPARIFLSCRIISGMTWNRSPTIP